ncbi:DUF1534 domain-containing protein [Pseudomonas syringae]|uniref:DUF1534 domain-containing protein n=1 Tax=Pseudomonas syringae TaxID=317 RepID=A0A9Q4A2F3_PSESX|nr:DUF1534 domain-containing protein [Pseudomonas syringae]MCF5474035.1 DUF1534 domain-containing protein [Pseudomonas syringae]MCF5481235.1 DUF1534 domain-containing protein [Pseudomonas syringae]MCF5488373.1 DUF1534 domain-containing protein [Pseudomonas syringae]MCF5491852.1 DUF1534 domain-containing protein [Pseudomonas syringae]
MGTMKLLRSPIVPHALRRNAHRDAPRHTFRIGRRASRQAYPRGAWVRWYS